MLQALLLLVSFVGLLWTLPSYARFEFHGREVVIPGDMVRVAIGHAAIVSGLTWLVGRPLIRFNQGWTEGSRMVKPFTTERRTEIPALWGVPKLLDGFCPVHYA